MSPKVFLIRHAHTTFDSTDPKQERFQGTVDVPLDPEGKVQAQQVASKLKDKNITKIYTSPLSRASDTADEIGRKLGIKPIKHDGLGPWDIGDFATKTAEDAGPKLEHYQKNPDVTPPGGEPYNDFIRRSRDAIASIFHEAASSGTNVGIVSHSRNLLDYQHPEDTPHSGPPKTGAFIVRDAEGGMMPSVSQAQQEATAIAKNSPEKLYARNRGLLSMTKSQLGDFARTPRKGLPYKKNLLRSK